LLEARQYVIVNFTKKGKSTNLETWPEGSIILGSCSYKSSLTRKKKFR